MKKRITYMLNVSNDNNEVLRKKAVECDESSLEQTIKLVMMEAFNGEYSVEDVEDEEATPTPEERIAELEEALEMLLNGVTE